MPLSSHREPLVTVITPVYNGAAYIGECIESVLRQTYGNWQYVICDNKSTDNTAQILRAYADKDDRIVVQNTDELLFVIDNWNYAISFMSGDAEYCKFLHADDWLYPECLAEMVAVATDNPTVGMVSAYRLEENKPSFRGIPWGQTVTPGAQVCRDTLLHKLFVFGSPTNVLYRADLVRESKPFFDPSFLHADREVCLRLLEKSDLGFVFKILSFTRRHNESETSRSQRFNTRSSENLLMFKEYGPKYFSPEEFQAQMKVHLDQHYRCLAQAVLERRGKAFWEYQCSILNRLGSPLSYASLLRALLIEAVDFGSTVRKLRANRRTN